MSGRAWRCTVRRSSIVLVLALCPALAFAGEGRNQGKDGTRVAQAGTTAPGGVPEARSRVLQKRAVLPTKMVEVMTAAADTSEAFARWIGTTPEAAKKEHEFLIKTAKEQREIAEKFQKLSETMLKGRDVPNVTYPMGAPAMSKALSEELRFAKAERELAQMLIQDAAEAEQRVQTMRQGAGGN